MSNQKLFCVHAEADTRSELITRVEGALAELKGVGGGAAEAPAKSGKGKAEKAADAGPKLTVDQVKQALQKLKVAIGGEEDEAKKGIKVVKKILKDHGVSQTPDLKEDQYASVMKAVEAAMPKEADEDEDGGEF